MLIDTGMTIAYKCSSCGTFEFIDVSLFKLLPKVNCFKCRCSMSEITISRVGSFSYKINVPCIGCGGEHSFPLDGKKILSDELNILSCPEKGTSICIIGRDGDVRKKVDSLEHELDEMINMLGYDIYFKNTQVMLDSLNRIHDLAEQGNLLCECGNDDIDLILLSDKICLQCKRCKSTITVFAATNEDLKAILARQFILLSHEYSKYISKNENPGLRKTDG